MCNENDRVSNLQDIGLLGQMGLQPRSRPFLGKIDKKRERLASYYFENNL